MEKVVWWVVQTESVDGIRKQILRYQEERCQHYLANEMCKPNSFLIFSAQVGDTIIVFLAALDDIKNNNHSGEKKLHTVGPVLQPSADTYSPTCLYLSFHTHRANWCCLRADRGLIVETWRNLCWGVFWIVTLPLSLPFALVFLCQILCQMKNWNLLLFFEQFFLKIARSSLDKVEGLGGVSL
mgnify:CR=1 FL=1